MTEESNAQRIHLEPISPERWPAELAVIKGMIPSDLNVYRTMAHDPQLLLALAPLRKHIVVDTLLSKRQMEFVVLRTARNTGTEYEWAHHVRRGKACGMTDAEIESVRVSEPIAFEPPVSALMCAVDELTQQRAISPETWRSLDRMYGPTHILPIIATVGFYTLLAYVINSCGVRLEE